jgi:2-phosphosulfolactate phosphatase
MIRVPQADLLSITIHFQHQLVDPAALKGTCCVVIDILRATTSIVHALGSGAEFVLPCETIEQAQAVAITAVAGKVLLGGERHGVRIEGFQLDNSPYSYMSPEIAGKTIVFTTTNGTQAIATCRYADRVLIGSFANFSAIVRLLKTMNQPIHLICAGTDHATSLEDVLFAGMVLESIYPPPNPNESLAWSEVLVEGDETLLARTLAQYVGDDAQKRLQILNSSRGGRNLIELGLARDIERACQLDLFDIVPSWDAQSGKVTLLVD